MARASGRDVAVTLMAEVAELKAAMQSQSEQMQRLSEHMAGNVDHFSRIGKLLGQSAARTRERFESLEERVDALEHPTGK